MHQMRAEMEQLGKEVNEGEKGPVAKKMEEDGIKHSVASGRRNGKIHPLMSCSECTCHFIYFLKINMQ